MNVILTISNLIPEMHKMGGSTQNQISAIATSQDILSNITMPKNLASAISIGILVACILMLLIFFALCVIYIHSKQTNKQNSQPEKKEKKTESMESLNIIKFEELPILSGRLGEILSLNGILKVGPLTKSFFRMLEIIKDSTYNLKWRYKMPCYLMIGAENSGKSSILNGLNIEKLSSEYANNDAWFLFKEAAILEFPKIDESQEESAFWEFLSELFIFIRPRRPLDGLIITIPVDVLISNNINLDQYAHNLFEKVFKFQKNINFKLPIYILITKCDLIPGFENIASSVVAYLQQQMFGWSNPYNIKTTFTSELIKEIFVTIENGIRISCTNAMHQKIDQGSLKTIALFEERFKKIKHSLNIIFETMFKIHNPTEGVMLRGVYLTGKQTLSSQVKENILQPYALNPNTCYKITSNNLPEYNDNLFFIQDVFVEKIFKEHNLATPLNFNKMDVTKNSLKNKILLTAAITTSSITWIYGNYNIRLSIEKHNKSLEHLQNTIQKVQYLENNASNLVTTSSLNERIVALLNAMPIIARFDLFSVFVPQSWISSIRQDIIDTISLVFDSMVIRAMYLDLNINTKNCVNVNSENISEKNDLLDISSFYSYKILNEYIKKIQELEKLSKEYNYIIKSEDRSAISDLTIKLFKDNPGIQNIIASGQPSKVLAKTFDLNTFRPHIEETLRKAFNNFLNDIFDPIILKIVETIQNDINQLEKSSKIANIFFGPEELAKLYDKTNLLNDLVKNANFIWIHGNDFTSNKDFKNAINGINTLDVISASCLNDILRNIAVRFEHFKHKLCTYETKLTNKILNNKAMCSTDFVAFQKELKIILEQPFIQSMSKKNFITDLFDDKILLWDIKRLKELSNIIDNYTSFHASSAAEIRPNCLEIYKRISRKCFYPSLCTYIASAQDFEDIPLGASRQILEENYKRQANNMQSISIYIPKIINLLDEMQEEDLAKDIGFARVIINEAISLLEKVDALFRSELPYSSHKGMFDAWDGENDPQYLGITSKDDLKQYLIAQFSRIKILAKDIAEPAVNFLALPALKAKLNNSSLLLKWKSIITAVNEYEKKTPGNSIAALETFLEKTLSTVSINTIDEKSNINEIANNKDDYFMEKRADVAKSLISRAEQLKLDKAIQNYKKVADYFNKNLSSKYPFNKDSTTDSTIAEINKFLDFYAKYSDGIENILEKYKEQKSFNENAFSFLTELDDVMLFLTKWVEHSKSTSPDKAVISFEIKLRPAPDAEKNVSSVVDRKFSINDSNIADESNFIYFNKDSINVEFDWVASSEEQPDKDQTNDNYKNMSINEHTASFKYQGIWSILRLIADYGPKTNVDSSNGIPLTFKVPTYDINNGKKAQSKMQMHITPYVKNNDKNEPLNLPNFPLEAPDLVENVHKKDSSKVHSNVDIADDIQKGNAE